MTEDIQFLKDLQKELQTQDHDCQAAPRFWTVGDYHMVECAEGNQDSYRISLPNKDYYGDLNAFLVGLKKEVQDMDEYLEDAKDEFAAIECEVSALDWIKEHYDEDAYLTPVREEHFIQQSTMFLTKAEAKQHIELNHYHYSERAHTYAMSAWRAPKVERLLQILETFDWDKI
mgnify:FL=1